MAKTSNTTKKVTKKSGGNKSSTSVVREVTRSLSRPATRVRSTSNR